MSTPDYPGFELEFRSEDGSTMIQHLGGIPWWQAPVPPRIHQCVPQTSGLINYFTLVFRCACGARKSNLGPAGWSNKNSRRSEEVSPRRPRWWTMAWYGWVALALWAVTILVAAVTNSLLAIPFGVVFGATIPIAWTAKR